MPSFFCYSVRIENSKNRKTIKKENFKKSKNPRPSIRKIVIFLKRFPIESIRLSKKVSRHLTRKKNIEK